MSEQNNPQPHAPDEAHKRSPWLHIVRGFWRSPIGILGVSLFTISASLMLVGLVADLLGLFDNPYAAMVTYMVLPGGMITGLVLVPLSAYLRRRNFHRHGLERTHLQINLSDHNHRKVLLAFLASGVITVSFFAIIAYEGYHFTDSAYFCGEMCHQVMGPEYTAYQRSAHSKVACVECHIGSGAKWFVQAKISGLRQVVGVLTDSYSRPIPAPVEHLRPARDTCEECHWPDKFAGKKVKRFIRFSDDDQVNPEVQDIALHIGGRNPRTDNFEGIHWHVSQDVEVYYLPVDKKRTKIARVKLKRPDGSTDEFIDPELDKEAKEKGITGDDEHAGWRLMGCIDCHNRPTHVYDELNDRVDIGLLKKELDPAIPGIREDSMTVLSNSYTSREAARGKIPGDLIALQKARDPKLAEEQAESLKKAGQYLIDAYMDNVWPKMKVTWGTYRSHLGHQFADDGFGCWRCHNEEHVNKEDENISQDCAICHDEPE